MKTVNLRNFNVTIHMKKVFCLATFACFTLWVTAQDTATVYLDNARKANNGNKPVYIRKSWKEGDLWHAQQFSIAKLTLLQDAFYEDEAMAIKHGPWMQYHDNGMMSDSVAYVHNKAHGERLNWDRDGKLTALLHYTNNILTDTCVRWHSNGAVASIRVCNERGTGLEQLRGKDGKTVVGSGSVVEGKKQGLWVFKDMNGVLSQQIEYAADTIVNITCYDTNGAIEIGQQACVEKKSAGFPGGLTGWRTFLERNMRYPDEAQTAKLSGEVVCRFIVDENGNIKNPEIVSSPGLALSKEALRILRASPKWVPAELHNRKMEVEQTQKLTFRLQ